MFFSIFVTENSFFHTFIPEVFFFNVVSEIPSQHAPTHLRHEAKTG